jgi:hypothetical protein
MDKEIVLAPKSEIARGQLRDKDPKVLSVLVNVIQYKWPPKNFEPNNYN